MNLDELEAADKETLDPKLQQALSDKANPPKTSLVKTGGELKSITTLGKEALIGLGIAGELVGVAFVILDFVEHNWVGAGIGLAGVAAGLATAVAMSSPMGWVVGGAIAALFSSK